MERHAYATLQIKAADEKGDRGIIIGIASTPTPDRVDDIVEPDGAVFKMPIPLLWQHDHGSPIGNVTEATVTDKGIEVVAEVALGVTDEITKAWKLIKSGLVRGLSIGFRGLDKEKIEGSWGVRFKRWEWLELSAVTIPANVEASIATVKQFASETGADPAPKAASGETEGKSHPGVTGKRKPVKLKEGNMATLTDQIAALEAKRAADAARMEEIMQKSIDAGETTDEEAQEEFDTLEAEVAQLDADIKRLKTLERVKAATAKPVEGVKSAETGSQARDPAPAPARVKVKENLPQGINFARLARVKALAHLDHRPAPDVAKSLYGEDSAVTGLVTKADVIGGASISGNWADFLVGSETDVYADFAEYLRPTTIVGKFGMNGIPSLRNVPFRTALLSQTAGGQGYWVGEGKPKPLTSFDGARTTLDELKVASIAVATEELLRKSSPSADALLRDQLAAAVRERIDTDFIDPAKAASAGVSPASITNGVSATTATSPADADGVRTDVRALFSTFIAADNPPTTGVWIMSANTALALSLMVNPLGQAEFPGVTMSGGSFMGLPVITSEYFAPVSAGGYVALVNAGDIYFADEGGVMVDVSREASLQMLDNPTNDTVTPTATTMVSMWQTNSVAFRAERILNWSKRRSSAVALLDSVNWGT